MVMWEVEEAVAEAVKGLLYDVERLEIAEADDPSSSSSSDSDPFLLNSVANSRDAPKKKKKRVRDGKRRTIRPILDSAALSLETLSAQARERERLARLSRIPTPPIPVSPALSDDIIVLSADDEAGEDEEEESEPSTSAGDGGPFADDRRNVPDSQGRLLVNPGKGDEEPDIFVPAHLAAKLKPHQLGGVRFMYSNTVEDAERLKSSPGFGCILAHSMGLGKTLQVVTFSEILFRNTETKRVLIIVPVNTLQNWAQEFDKWSPVEMEKSGGRPYHVRVMNDAVKTKAARTRLLQEWMSSGGVMVMGYELFRRLVSRDTGASVSTAAARKRRRLMGSNPTATDDPASAAFVDLEEEEAHLSTTSKIKEALLDPGPDFIICDEGHRIKNLKTGTAKVLNSIRTRRRIVLTGSPLQNNLMEYWCMVDFVRPKFLGTRHEFANMFERPIQNGQCSDSTVTDKHLARQRTHVLTNMLRGFVQRRGHGLLHCILPAKREWVLWTRKSPIQARLYQRFVTAVVARSDGCNPLKAFAICCKVPYLLLGLLHCILPAKREWVLWTRKSPIQARLYQRFVTAVVALSDGCNPLKAFAICSKVPYLLLGLLHCILPAKREWVLWTRKSPIQARLYQRFVTAVVARSDGCNPLKAFAICCKVPYLLLGLLHCILPAKREWVLWTRKSPIQARLYQRFVTAVVARSDGCNPLKAFAICCKVPYLLLGLLHCILPAKREWVLWTRKSPIQARLYQRFVTAVVARSDGCNPLKAFAICCKVPYLLLGLLHCILPAKREWVLWTRKSPIQARLYQRFVTAVVARSDGCNPLKAFTICCKWVLWTRKSPIQARLYQRFVTAAVARSDGSNPLKAFAICCKVPYLLLGLLHCILPAKREWVLWTRKSPIQARLYQRFVTAVVARSDGCNPLKAFAICCKVPYLLLGLLHCILPAKREWVLWTRKSPIQARLYQRFVTAVVARSDGCNPLKAFAICCKVPYLLLGLLHCILPAKREWVLCTRKSPIQARLYQRFVTAVVARSDGCNPLKAFAICCKVPYLLLGLLHCILPAKREWVLWTRKSSIQARLYQRFVKAVVARSDGCNPLKAFAICCKVPYLLLGLLHCILPAKREWVLWTRKSPIQARLYQRFVTAVVARSDGSNPLKVKAFAICCKVPYLLLGLLHCILPAKREWVLWTRKSPIQARLYQRFVTAVVARSDGCNPLKAFAICCKVPYLLLGLLHCILPAKREWVLWTRKSPIQARLYQRFVTAVVARSDGCNPLKAFAICCKVPYLLLGLLHCILPAKREWVLWTRKSPIQARLYQRFVTAVVARSDGCNPLKAFAICCKVPYLLLGLLHCILPAKREWVLWTRKSPIQARLYQRFVTAVVARSDGCNPLKAFAICCKVPYLLLGLLHCILPAKREWVLWTRKSPIQARLYQRFVTAVVARSDGCNPLKAFAICCKVPYLLLGLLHCILPAKREWVLWTRKSPIQARLYQRFVTAVVARSDGCNPLKAFAICCKVPYLLLGLLHCILPAKREWVLWTRKSPIQARLYQRFVTAVVARSDGCNPLKAFAICCKVPYLLLGLLHCILPAKREWVLWTRKSPIQARLYQRFVTAVVARSDGCNPLKAFAICCKVPYLLLGLLHCILPAKREWVLWTRKSPIQARLYQRFVTAVVARSDGCNPLKAFAICCKVPYLLLGLLHCILPAKREWVLWTRKSPIQARLYQRFVTAVVARSDGCNPLKAFAICCKVPYLLLGLLHCILPAKREWVLWTRKSPIQARLYQRFVTAVVARSDGCNPLKAFAICCKIWNHPDILATFLERRAEEMDEVSADLDFDGMGYNGDDLTLNLDSYHLAASSPSHRKRKTHRNGNGMSSNYSTSNLSSLVQDSGWDPFASKGIDYSWAEDILAEGYEKGAVEAGYKLVLALAIIETAVARGEKVLLFSQSLLTLNVMEEFLRERGSLMVGVEYGPWRRNTNYFRLDGSTNATERQRLISRFETEPQIGLFLISTRAGSLGINLTAANRAIVFDASWNPCHDTQAICRIFRYGQARKTFVYRLVTDNSMERAIFNRQLGKMGMADRVVDSKASDPNVTRAELKELINYDAMKDEIPPSWEVPDEMDDDILEDICSQFHDMLSQAPVRHESLLVEGSERRMTKAEARRAQAAYDRELQDLRGTPSSSFSPSSNTPASLPSNSRWGGSDFLVASNEHHAYANTGAPSMGGGLPDFQSRPWLPHNQPDSTSHFFKRGLLNLGQQTSQPPGTSYVLPPDGTLPQNLTPLQPPAYNPEPRASHVPPIMPGQPEMSALGMGSPLREKHIICSQEVILPSMKEPERLELVRAGTAACILQTTTGIFLVLKDERILNAAGSVYGSSIHPPPQPPNQQRDVIA